MVIIDSVGIHGFAFVNRLCACGYQSLHTKQSGAISDGDVLASKASRIKQLPYEISFVTATLTDLSVHDIDWQWRNLLDRLFVQLAQPPPERRRRADEDRTSRQSRRGLVVRAQCDCGFSTRSSRPQPWPVFRVVHAAWQAGRAQRKDSENGRQR